MMRVVVVSTALLAACNAAVAQTAPPVAVFEGVDQRLSLRPGTGLILRTQRRVREGFVADNNVVDLHPRSDREMFMVAKKDGTTTVFLVDENGETFFGATVTVGRASVDRIRIYGTRTGLHAYWPYQCSGRRCERTDDPLAAQSEPERTVERTITITRPPPAPRDR